MREKLFLIIEPNVNKDNEYSAIYDWIMLFVILLSLAPLMFKEQTAVLVAIDDFSCICFINDYLLRWVTADFKLGKKYGRWSFLIYPFTLVAIIDLLSILPSLNLINKAFKVFRVSRLLRIVRIAKVLRYYEPLQIMVRVLKKERSVLTAFLVSAFLYIFVIALIMYNVEGLNPQTGKPVFSDFFEALYWSTCTLTTIGYGDFYPVSTAGRVICMISSLVGVAVIALPSGAITSAYMDEIKKRKTQE